jgi:recombination protein RecT
MANIQTFEGKNNQEIINTLQGNSLNIYNSIHSYLSNTLNSQNALQITANFIMNNKLQHCTQKSLVSCIIKALEYGFRPGFGDLFYIVPFKNTNLGVYEATFMMSFKGMCNLFYRTGKVNEVYAECVYENDIFEYELGLNKKLVHIPNYNSERGKFRCAYSVTVKTNGYKSFSVVSKNYIDKIRNEAEKKYKDKTNSFWSKHFEEMAKKTALRYHFKYSDVFTYDNNTEILDKAITEENEYNAKNDFAEDIKYENTAYEIIEEVENNNLNETKIFNRPYTIGYFLVAKGNDYNGKILNEAQIKLISYILNTITENKDSLRKEIQKFLFGIDSLKNATKPMLDFIIEWTGYKSKEWQVNDILIQEVQIIFEYMTDNNLLNMEI